MKNAIRMISVLTAIGLISGTALVFMYSYANPLIEENRINETKEAIFKIFPQAEQYKEQHAGGITVFEVTDKSKKSLGYAFLADGNGYQGTIKMMVGIKLDLSALVGIEILESQETPGLGQEITKDTFRSQFIGLVTMPAITYVKNAKPEKPGQIQAITGATVSSSAVINILNEKIGILREKLVDTKDVSS
ncbi:MAG: FMN-binding protein [Candidatus Omnitrophota bacterium]